MSDALLTSQDERLLTVTINRPSVRNALDLATTEQLGRVLELANADEAIRGVILTGAGGVFCSGDDLNEASSVDVPHFMRQVESLQTLTECIRRLPLPVVAAIDGAAYGGGLELAVSCDARIASTSSVFACPEPAWGLTLTNGASALLPRLVGDGWAKELTMFGRVLDSETAERIGLVTRIAPSTEVLENARLMLTQTLAYSNEALALTKRLLDASPRSVSEALAQEVDTVVSVFDTEFARKRLNSFRDGTWREGGGAR